MGVKKRYHYFYGMRVEPNGDRWIARASLAANAVTYSAPSKRAIRKLLRELFGTPAKTIEAK